MFFLSHYPICGKDTLAYSLHYLCFLYYAPKPRELSTVNNQKIPANWCLWSTVPNVCMPLKSHFSWELGSLSRQHKCSYNFSYCKLLLVFIFLILSLYQNFHFLFLKTLSSPHISESLNFKSILNWHIKVLNLIYWREEYHIIKILHTWIDSGAMNLHAA